MPYTQNAEVSSVLYMTKLYMSYIRLSFTYRVNFTIPGRLVDVGVLPAPWITDENGDTIVVHDSGPYRANRVYVFGGKEGLEILRWTDTIYIDGNFSMDPSQFAQLYVIRAMVEGVALSAAYALIPNKTTAAYTEAAFYHF